MVSSGMVSSGMVSSGVISSGMTSRITSVGMVDDLRFVTSYISCMSLSVDEIEAKQLLCSMCNTEIVGGAPEEQSERSSAYDYYTDPDNRRPGNLFLHGGISMLQKNYLSSYIEPRGSQDTIDDSTGRS